MWNSVGKDLHIGRLKYYVVVPRNKATYHKVTQTVKAGKCKDSKGKISRKKKKILQQFVMFAPQKGSDPLTEAALCFAVWVEVEEETLYA